MVARQEPNANGVTYGAHGQGRDKECYAEFEMTHVNKDSSKWQACLFEGKSYPICNIYIRFIHVYIAFNELLLIIILIV